jgi:DNA-binding MarR family transcriptional regulator
MTSSGSSSGGPTILLDVFLTNQHRKRMIEAALAGAELPAEDYPIYVLVGAEGPWTPTGLARRLEMPLSTMLFRLGRLERRGHAERVPNPKDGRSYLIRLTDEGQRLLGEARPAFRDYAEAVEGRLGTKRVAGLRAALEELRDAVVAELEQRRG